MFNNEKCEFFQIKSLLVQNLERIKYRKENANEIIKIFQIQKQVCQIKLKIVSFLNVHKKQMKLSTSFVLALIACVSSVWPLPTKHPGEFEQFRYEYCIFNGCSPFEDCYMFKFCRYGLLHRIILESQQTDFGKPTDFSKFRDVTVPLFNSTVKIFPKEFAEVLGWDR